MRRRSAGASGAPLAAPRGRRIGALAAAVFLAAFPAAAVDSLDAEAARLARKNELLAKQLELARGKDFYVLFDRPRSRLVLMLRAAVLHEWPVRGVEVGIPRVAFLSREVRAEWQGRIWSGGRLDPPREKERMVIEAPPPREDAAEQSEPAVPIPPTPEELYPVPARYHVRYEGGLSLEIRVSPTPSGERGPGFWSRLRARLAQWWSDLRAVVRVRPLDTVRVRLILAPEDAASLYRALPPDTKLLVIPPE